MNEETVTRVRQGIPIGFGETTSPRNLSYEVAGRVFSDANRRLLESRPKTQVPRALAGVRVLDVRTRRRSSASSGADANQPAPSRARTLRYLLGDDIKETVELAAQVIEVRDLLKRLDSATEQHTLRDAIRRAGRLGGRSDTLLTPSERVLVTVAGVGAELDLRRSALTDALTLEQAAARLRVPVELLAERSDAGRVVALTDDGGVLRLPQWQFDENSATGLLPGLPEVLLELGARPPLSRIGWLTTPKPQLRGQSPIDALRDGQREDVRALALTAVRS